MEPALCKLHYSFKQFKTSARENASRGQYYGVLHANYGVLWESYEGYDALTQRMRGW